MIHKKSKILISGILAILVLTACATDDQVTQKTQQSTLSSNPPGLTDTSSTIGESQVNSEGKPVNRSTQQKILPLPTQAVVMDQFQGTSETLTATEKAAFDAALKLQDPGYCEKMSTDENKRQCKTALQDKMVLDGAITAADASMCEKMSTNDLKEACKIQVDVVAREQQKKIQFTSDVEKSREINASKDYTRCSKELKDPAVVDSCELTIIMNLALEKNDVSLCEKITSSEAEARCKEDFRRLSAPGA